MRNRRRIFWIILILLAVFIPSAVAWTSANNSWQERYRQWVSEGIVYLLQTNPFDRYAVVVIVIDGLRWEEGIDAEDEYIPHIWNDLRPMGTLLTNYQIASPTVTTSSHSALMTGRVSTVPNDGHIRPVFPTFIEYYRDARSEYVEHMLEETTRMRSYIFRPNAETIADVSAIVAEAAQFPPERTPLYLGKDLIYSIGQSSSGHYPADDCLVMDHMRDHEITEYFRAKIPDVHPSMVVVNLGDVDECGHEAEWHYYVDAIRHADRHVWEMWQALQAESRYRDKTFFIITTDHGRHIPSRGGYPHHGDFCEGCRHSFALIIGPGIRQGVVSDELHHETDIAPTIGLAMDFDTPGCSGSPIMEAFEPAGAVLAQYRTATMQQVEADRIKVDERDTIRLMLETLRDDVPESAWEDKTTTAMGILAMSAAIHANPDYADIAEEWIEGLIPDSTQVEEYNDLDIAYPIICLGREMSDIPNAAVTSYSDTGWELYEAAMQSGLTSDPPGQTHYSTIALLAPLMATAGNERDDPSATRFAYSLLLNTLAHLEETGRVYNPSLDDFVDDYHYRQPSNEIFVREDLTMRDRMWLLWSIERVLAESNEEHVPDLHPYLLRQYRLLAAFMNVWQDANAMVGGTGDLDGEIDFVAQGLALSSLAEFKPWRRWELDELGYSPNIYATPLYSWPARHFFYILGQANALAGGWTANERLRIFVQDDGGIRHDLVDAEPAIMPSDAGYAEAAAALAYGFARFELADYNMYDLEMYPLVHQQNEY